MVWAIDLYRDLVTRRRHQGNVHTDRYLRWGVLQYALHALWTAAFQVPKYIPLPLTGCCFLLLCIPYLPEAHQTFGRQDCDFRPLPHEQVRLQQHVAIFVRNVLYCGHTGCPPHYLLPSLFVPLLHDGGGPHNRAQAP